jgi:Tfp pilus assembly protein PilO
VKKFSVTIVMVIAVVAGAAAAYLMVLRPKTAEVKQLDTEIATLDTELDAAIALAQPGEKPELPIKVADLVELAKAMPDDTGIADAILELNSAAEGAGVEFLSISPDPPVPGSGYTQMPLKLTFEGNYYNLTELVYRLRSLVAVRDGVLHAKGRLFTLDSLNWHEGEAGFPMIQADLVVSAYVYGNNSVPALTPSGTAATTSASTGQTTTGETTTSTTDTTATTTTSDPSAPPAAPADPTQQAQGVSP